MIDMWLNDQLLFKPKTVPRGGQVKLKCRNAQGAPGIFTLDTGPSRGDVFDQIHKPILSADQSEVTISEIK